jgi:hypothetical protein
MVMARAWGIGRVGGLVLLALGFVIPEARAQGRADTPERRLSLEVAAGPQVSYVGSTVSTALGFAPTRNFTVLVSLERSHVRDEIDVFDDGYAFERGGTETSVSVELRYAFLADRRVSPYVLGGAGRGVSRPSVNEFFPEPNERNIQVIYYGGGVRIPLTPRLDAFTDARFIMALEGRSDYFGVRFPVRGGIAWRF